MQTTQSRFTLGQVMETPGAREALRTANHTPDEFLGRHLRGDWGNVPQDDKLENEFSLKNGFRLLSSYELRDGTTLWIITEADRSLTTLLLPSDY